MSYWESLWDRLQEIGTAVIDWAILLGIALVVLVIGRWIIGLVRKAIEVILGASALDGIWKRSGVAKALAEGEQTPASLVATLVYAYLMVGLFMIATRILELATIEARSEPESAGLPYLAHHFLAVSIPPTPKAMARAIVVDAMTILTTSSAKVTRRMSMANSRPKMITPT